MFKNVAIPVGQLEKALDGEIMFDGSSIEGFTRIEESDMNLQPDYSTFAVFPWRTRRTATTARLICDVYKPDGEPFRGRSPLRAEAACSREAKAMGFTVNAGPEAEFFLFRRDADGRADHDHARCGRLLRPRPRRARRRRAAGHRHRLGRDGLEVEASHHEVAIGQHEIDFQYDDALRTADRVTTFKFVTRAIAHLHDLHATFMPKPIFGINGSGMHTHMSLDRKTARTPLPTRAASTALSETALQFIAGLLEHARGFTAVTNPLVNSYKRLVPGYEAPVYIAWSATNRSALDPGARPAGAKAPASSCARPTLVQPVSRLRCDDRRRARRHQERTHASAAPRRKNIYHMTPEEARGARHFEPAGKP